MKYRNTLQYSLITVMLNLAATCPQDCWILFIYFMATLKRFYCNMKLVSPLYIYFVNNDTPKINKMLFVHHSWYLRKQSTSWFFCRPNFFDACVNNFLVYICRGRWQHQLYATCHQGVSWQFLHARGDPGRWYGGPYRDRPVYVRRPRHYLWRLFRRIARGHLWS